MNHEVPVPQQMFRMITGHWVSQAVGAFAELGLADQLAAGPRRPEDLATAVSADPDATFRLLRALGTLGVVTESDGRFDLTPLGSILRKDADGSLRDMARAQTMPGHWLPWGRFSEAVRKGQTQAGAALGSDIFGYYAQQPTEREAFLRAMHGLSTMVAAEAPRVYDASGHRELCDVGGSAGTIAAGFLRANPGLTATVLDLPEVVPLATRAIADAGLSERCRAVGGDFFVDVPEADLYVLKHVLHDWSDAQCETLLSNVARRIRPGGRVLVIEMVIPDDGSPSMAQLMDLNMLAMLPGRERTEAQYGDLLRSAGLRMLGVRPTHSPMQVVVAER